LKIKIETHPMASKPLILKTKRRLRLKNLKTNDLQLLFKKRALCGTVGYSP
jgi:hypothetical protein